MMNDGFTAISIQFGLGLEHGQIVTKPHWIVVLKKYVYETTITVKETAIKDGDK